MAHSVQELHDKLDHIAEMVEAVLHKNGTETDWQQFASQDLQLTEKQKKIGELKGHLDLTMKALKIARSSTEHWRKRFFEQKHILRHLGVGNVVREWHHRGLTIQHLQNRLRRANRKAARLHNYLSSQSHGIRALVNGNQDNLRVRVWDDGIYVKHEGSVDNSEKAWSRLGTVDDPAHVTKQVTDTTGAFPVISPLIDTKMPDWTKLWKPITMEGEKKDGPSGLPRISRLRRPTGDADGA
jgi:hypothetical protein